MMQQKFLKRTAEELEPPGGSADAYEPPAKIQCTGPGGPQGQQSRSGPQPPQGQPPSSTENLTKFSVEIVQQLEFTTSAANSQPQQISTNVTVKALTNTSVKSDVSSPKSGPGTPASSVGGGRGNNNNNNNNSNIDIGNLVECKQEPDSEFVDLEQCAAALEKDAAANGAGFPGLSDLIGDDTSDEIITSDAFKDLISEISDFPFMKDFDFEDKSVDGLTNSNSASGCGGGVGGQMKAEDDKDVHHQQHQHLMDVVGKASHNNNNNNSPSPLMSGNPQYSPQSVYDQSLSKSRMAPYSGLDFSKAELSPAAQTLKQMAEQHQHKTQLGMGFNPSAGVRNVRSPYGEFQFPTSGNDYLGSPGSVGGGGGGGAGSNHATAPYLSKQVAAGGGNNFVNSGTQAELIKQEVMFSATQTAAFASGNLDLQKQRQVMQQLQQQQQAQQQQSAPPQGGQPAQQQAQQQQNAQSKLGGYATSKQQYSPYGSPNHGSPQYLPRGQAPGGPGQPVGPFSSNTPPRPPSCPGTTSLQINQAQQLQINQPGQQIQVTAGQHLQMSGDLKPGVSVAAQQGMYFSQQQPSSQPSQQVTVPGSESYSVSQSQTINFTQQSLRQRPGPRAVVEAAGGRQAMEQQKLLQQQMLRAQVMQQQQQQQQQQQHMGSLGPRPPPPEYKANPQLLHGLMGPQQRFPTGMRRVGQQPMPPSGPMMRPQQQQQAALHGGGGSMYMSGPVPGAGVVPHPHHLSTQHRMVNPAGTYATPGGRSNQQRSPNVSIGPDGLNIGGRGGAEWRHLLMSQQQSAVFNRPTFPQGSFGLGGSQGGMQMNASQMQHQQMVRNQALSGSPVSQMQMLSQQQSLGMQPSGPGPGGPGMGPGNQMSMSLQMSQSMSVSGGGGGSPHHHPHHSHMTQQQVGYSGSPGGAGGGNPGPPQHSSPASSQQSAATTVASSQNAVASQAPPDFSLEFLEHLPTGDSSHFSAAAQELLNSLDSTSTFNLQDIL